MPTVLETTDLDLAHHVLCNAYGKVSLSVVRGPFQMRLSRDHFGQAEIHRSSSRMRFSVTGPPYGMIGVGRMVRGTMTVHSHREEHRHSAPGEVFLGVHPGRDYRATMEGADIELAFFQPELLAQVAAVAPGRAARPLRFTGTAPVSPAAVAMWNTTFDFVRDNLVTVPVADTVLMEAGAARLLAAAALSTFPNNAVVEPTIEDRHDAHPATLRRAADFMDGNAHSDISAADIAAAAHVTIRTLQLAFRRHLGTTPMAHLRRIRLEHAHQDLLRSDPSTASVGAIAARWGIIGHSRFTSLYRAAYGVTPSKTLHNR